MLSEISLSIKQQTPQVEFKMAYCHLLFVLKLRSQILGSSEITKTNEVNLHGFCTDSFFK